MWMTCGYLLIKTTKSRKYEREKAKVETMLIKTNAISFSKKKKPKKNTNSSIDCKKNQNNFESGDRFCPEMMSSRNRERDVDEGSWT